MRYPELVSEPYVRTTSPTFEYKEDPTEQDEKNKVNPEQKNGDIKSHPISVEKLYTNNQVKPHVKPTLPKSNPEYRNHLDQGVPGPQGVPGKDGIQGPQGVPGRDGIQGPQGLQGYNGMNGKKTVLFNGDVVVSDNEDSQHIVTIPYDGSIHTLENISFVVSGSGPIRFEIRDIINDVSIGVTERDNANSKSVFQFKNFNNLANELTAISVYAKSVSSSKVKVLSIEFVM